MRGLGIVGIGLGLLGLLWVGVAHFVLPGWRMQAEEQGRALSVVEQLLFTASVATSNWWFVFAFLALVLCGVGAALLVAGGTRSEPD